jgi:hypothetical protein
VAFLMHRVELKSFGTKFILFLMHRVELKVFYSNSSNAPVLIINFVPNAPCGVESLFV